MRLDRMKHLLTFEKPVQTVAETGGVTESKWVEVGRFWCSLSPMSGKELMKANIQLEAVTTYEIHMRYTDLVTPFCRIRHDNKFMNITSLVDKDDLRQELVITAVESWL